MIRSPITQEQKDYAWQLVHEVNFGKRGINDGNIVRQYTGILGEVIVADNIGYDRPSKHNKGHYDGGVDFVIYGKNIDLKTMVGISFPQDYYANDIFSSQLKHEKSLTDIYAFGSIHKEKDIFTLCGFIEKINITNEFFVPKGYTRELSNGKIYTAENDMYEIQNRYLVQSRSWLEFVWAIHATTL